MVHVTKPTHRYNQILLRDSLKKKKGVFKRLVNLVTSSTLPHLNTTYQDIVLQSLISIQLIQLPRRFQILFFSFSFSTVSMSYMHPIFETVQKGSISLNNRGEGDTESI